jgi:hypothetical protein
MRGIVARLAASIKQKSFKPSSLNLRYRSDSKSSIKPAQDAGKQQSYSDVATHY